MEYLSRYPLIKHASMFTAYLSDEKEDWSIRMDSALGLGRLRDADSVELIIRVMEEKSTYAESEYNKTAYLRALAMIKGETAKRAVEKYKNSDKDTVKALVKELLEKWDR